MLAISHHDYDIIRLLHAERHKSSTGKPLTLSMIKWLRYKHRIPAPRPPGNALNVRQIRDRYGVSLWIVHYWIGRGLVVAHQRKPNAPYAVSMTTNLTSSSGPGSPNQYIYAHVKRKQHEVHYARHVGIPSGRSPLPPGFGIITRRTGAARDAYSIRSFLMLDSHPSSPSASTIANVTPSTPGAPLFARIRS